MDFFLRDHIKALISMLPVDSEEDLITRTFEEAATIRHQPSGSSRQAATWHF
jgi:hypothetical protein